ncbi:hypothetical protein N752_00035 [Desulforamulus aquiferis]|nr:hypothetical protein N752_00035 [Desulforamulus aquiferis]
MFFDFIEVDRAGWMLGLKGCIIGKPTYSKYDNIFISYDAEW